MLYNERNYLFIYELYRIIVEISIIFSDSIMFLKKDCKMGLTYSQRRYIFMLQDITSEREIGGETVGRVTRKKAEQKRKRQKAKSAFKTVLDIISIIVGTIDIIVSLNR